MATQPHWSEIESYEEEQFHQISFNQQHHSPKTIQQAILLESMQSSPSKVNKVADVKAAAKAEEVDEDEDENQNGIEENRIPVTCLTGFLGAGKTTLLNRILSAEHGKKIGVVINEWGAIGIDDKLVKLVNTKEEVYEMNNGCVCCTVRGDLIKVLHNLVVPDDDDDDDDDKKPKKTKFDMIIIETTGLADPGPVVQTMFMDEEIKENAYMDGVICVVDCGHVLGSLDRPRSEGAVNESAQQIAFADRLILNKTDLVNEQQLKEVERRIRVINPFAEIIKTKQSVVPIEKLLNIKSFDLDRILQIAPEFLENEKKGHEHGHSHDCKDQSCSHGHSHGDHSSSSSEGGKEHVHSRHDDGITSVGFERPGVCDMTRLNHFFASFLTNQGKNLFRYKGVLCVDGLDQPLVFSGVHMQLTSEPQGAFPTNRPREMNYLVFIGVDINKDQLIKDFEECLVKKQPSEKGNGHATTSQQKKQ